MASKQGTYTTQEERAISKKSVKKWRETIKIKREESKEENEKLSRNIKVMEAEMLKLLDDATSN